MTASSYYNLVADRSDVSGSAKPPTCHLCAKCQLLLCSIAAASNLTKICFHLPFAANRRHFCASTASGSTILTWQLAPYFPSHLFKTTARPKNMTLTWGPANHAFLVRFCGWFRYHGMEIVCECDWNVCFCWRVHRTRIHFFCSLMMDIVLGQVELLANHNGGIAPQSVYVYIIMILQLSNRMSGRSSDLIDLIFWNCSCESRAAVQRRVVLRMWFVLIGHENYVFVEQGDVRHHHFGSRSDN